MVEDDVNLRRDEPSGLVNSLANLGIGVGVIATVAGMIYGIYRGLELFIKYCPDVREIIPGFYR